MTIKDIAKISGFSVSTVSRALNDHPDVSGDAKIKIQQVVDEYKFVPNYNAKKLKQQVELNIAIIIKGRFNSMFSAIVEIMQERITHYGYHSESYFIDENSDEVRYARKVAGEHKPLGIIFLGGDVESFKRHFQQIDIPCILVTNSAVSLEFDNLSSVYTDDIGAAYCAMEYLIKNGHRKIGIIGGNLKKSFTSRQRFEGCVKCMKDYGVDFDEAMQYSKSRFSFVSSYESAKLLNENCPDLTAVFAMSDVMAVGAIRAFRDLGKLVPADISVIGFDGIELGRFYTPRIATIEQAQDKLANDSVDILIAAVRNASGAIHKETPFNLIEGESVRKL
ncbi:MAG: LacI family transcriptional regulator [Clostridiales bacterium]|nr:LacI family transcriptional regulator [Clostridiales bacterium]